MVTRFATVTPLTGEAVCCVECGLIADTADGWKAFLGGGFEGEPVEVVVYCPDCADRETGGAG